MSDTIGASQPAEWVPIVSRNLAAAKYDQQTQTLYVRFNSGGEYSYAGVPGEVADGLLNADNPGTYFYDTIRLGYEATRL